jgi:hypothetical protein
MKNWKVLILSFMVLLVLTSVAGAGETLYNGIVLPDPMAAGLWCNYARTDAGSLFG